MSRIRFTEGSSDDELDKLIKKREKRLQKRKDIKTEMRNSNIIIQTLQGSVDPTEQLTASRTVSTSPHSQVR